MRAALTALLACLPVAAQLQVGIVRDSGVEIIGASVNLGNTAAGDPLEARFRAANLGSATLPVNTISISGAGFTLREPFVPVALAPGAVHEFGVVFRPPAPGSYSASLVVGAFTAIVRANAVEAAEVSLIRNGQAITLPASGLTFEAFAGERLRIELELRNSGSSALAVTPLRVTGAGYQYGGPAGATLPPGETLRVPVVFTIGGPGTFPGTLEAGARRFPLVGLVRVAAHRPPRIELSSAEPGHARQLRIQLGFDEPLPVETEGTLRAEFVGAFPDPAIQFQNGQVSIPFTVPAGAVLAVFGEAAEAILQTGTTAGVLRLLATTGGGTATYSLDFPRAPIAADQVTVRRDGASVEFQMTGYDNTRTAGSANFQFFDRAGNPIGGMITARFEDAFRAYFAGAPAGGAFRLRAVFPVTGDATMVGSVLVEIANTIGRTELGRLTIP